MNISKHISYKEATRSVTAIRRGIENTPNDYQRTNMEAIAHNVFEPLREWVGGPIKINSFFQFNYFLIFYLLMFYLLVYEFLNLLFLVYR